MVETFTEWTDSSRQDVQDPHLTPLRQGQDGRAAGGGLQPADAEELTGAGAANDTRGRPPLRKPAPRASVPRAVNPG